MFTPNCGSVRSETIDYVRNGYRFKFAKLIKITNRMVEKNNKRDAKKK